MCRWAGCAFGFNICGEFLPTSYCKSVVWQLSVRLPLQARTHILEDQSRASAQCCERQGQGRAQVSSNYHPDCMSAQASSALRKEEAAEAGRELRALLRLLTNLTQRDLLDFGSTPDGPRVDVAQVSTRSRDC